ncbi:Putative small multi-drug export protein [uncultured archaeon]|nr:Putative small multi-drug export protein [uncultured archaeon]
MFDIIAAIIQAVGNPVLVAFVLGFLPVSEVRGAAIYAFSVGQPWLIIPGAIGNILACPIILAIWDIVNIPFWGRLILGKRLEKRLLDFGKHYERQGLVALTIFMGLPIPLTGVYTGTLIAELFGIKRRYILLTAVAGVALAAIFLFFFLGGLKMVIG